MRPYLYCLALLALSIFSAPVPGAADGAGGPALADYLDSLNDLGQTVIYSSDLVTEGMFLADEPALTPTLAELQELLQPFGLTATTGPAKSFLIVSLPEQAPMERPEPAEPEVTPIPEIIVTSSLHRLDYTHPTTHTYLDRKLVTRIPTMADEAVRLTNRLPGTANGGVSARNHIRGGQANEVLFLFDGLRLYEPYHLKDFQAIATIINANAIGGMDFYTGAYPARYGDRMSGVLSVELRQPEKPIETELALSFFNASLLSTGAFGDAGQGDWLVSARRGNLDLIVDVIDPEFGSPDYQDYLAHVGWEFGPGSQLSANFLISDDKLRLVDSDRGEQATASYSNRVGWVKWRAEWTDSITSDTILALSEITDRRFGALSLPGIVSGKLDEIRKFTALEIRQDWCWVASDTWMFRYGLNIKDLDAKYRFSSAKTVLPPFDAVLDNQPSTIRGFELAPSGAQYAAYVELRWWLLDRWIVDLGMRWDQQTYTTSQDDKQYSPRASILYQPSKKSELRFGWGRYYQAQEINELQVSDGIANFFPAQQAEHVVINFRHQFESGIDADVSLYRKRFRSLRPRFENSFNALTLLPELQFDRIVVDPSRAEAHGAELMLSRGSSDEDLFWWLAYAWSQIEDKTTGGDVARSWDQTHTFKGGLSWRWGRWGFSAAVEAHSGWPRTTMTGKLLLQPDGSEFLALEVSERNGSRYSDFHALDIRVSRDFDLTRGELTAFLEITNLYDRGNPCCIEYSVRRDGALASRDKRWPPLVPSLGVTWRF